MSASRILLAATASLAMSLSVANQPSLPADLAKAAADYDRAQVKGDAAELNRLLAQDYHLVNGGGQIESKPQFVAESSDPTFKLDPFEVESPLTTVWNDGAVLAGEVHLAGSDHGKAFKAHFRFADIWRKHNGTWQVVFTEVTRVP
jgi:hypothetical protein